MRTELLRAEWHSLLAEIRSAGAGTSAAQMDALLKLRIPGLVCFSDPREGEALPEASKERGLEKFLEAVRARAQASVDSPTTAGDRWDYPWSLRRRRVWTWSLGLAGAAVILLLLSWYAGLIGAKKEYIAVPGPRRTSPDTPPSPKLPLRPEGPLVRQGPKTEIRVAPVPKQPKPDERVAVRLPQAGTFGAVVGEPLVYAPGEAKGVYAKPGMAVVFGSRIETGDFSKAQLKFADGTVLQMDFNATLVIPGDGSGKRGEDAGSLPSRPDLVELQIGRMYASVVRLPDRTNFQVRTPAATAEVLGTEFSLNVLKRKKPDSTDAFLTVLDVKTGEVRFGNELGSVLASDLMRSTASEGDKPTEPVRIRAFPGTWLGHMHLTAVTQPLLASTALDRMAPYQVWNGIQVNTVDGKIWITKILVDSAAFRAGLKAKDIIEAINGRPQTLHWNVVAAEHLFAGRPIEFTVRRGEQILKISVPPVESPFPPMPGVLSVAEQLGPTLFDVGMDRTGARRRLEALVVTNPHPAYWNNLGLLWQVDDVMGKALRCFQKAIALDPENALYRSNYAGALGAIGNSARAGEERARAAELARDWPIAQQDHVNHLVGIGRLDQALQEIDRLIANEPDFGAWHYLKGFAFYRMQKMPEAVASLQRYLHSAPDSAEAYGLLGLIHIYLRKYEVAIEYLNRAHEIDPKSDVYTNNLGMAYADMGNLVEGERWYRLTIELGPNHPVAYGNLGQILRDTGRPKEAEEVFRKGIVVNPEYEGIYNSLGHMAWKQGKYREAEALFRKCLSIDPRAIWACANLGSMLDEDLNRNAEAVALYRQFLKLNPGAAVISNNLAGVLAELGQDLDEALAAVQVAIQDSPNRPNRQWTMADVYTARKEWDLAEAAYRKAIEMYGTSKDAGECWEAMGLMFEKKGDVPSAKEALRKALSIDPNVKKAAAALKRLGGEAAGP
ncbi:MAG: tetratricopeptide repeat protein [Armatimonadetes bacterium]|nr:MAG: tetratricopeptide repeat protein [Armatimonadota bacterium]